MAKKNIIFLIIILFLLFSLIDTDLSVNASDKKQVNTDNEMDVYFSSVSSLNGTDVKLSSDGSTLDFGTIMLNNVGDKEVITYELVNGKTKYDISADVLINDVQIYNNDYFNVECSDIGVIKKGESKFGTITISLKKNALDDVTLPLNFSINVNPIYKINRLFK